MIFNVKNKFGEKLDVLVEGKKAADTMVVFVHGFGTDKNEGLNLFVDISKELKTDYRLVRFDFSGYGKSEGKQEDACYSKLSGDLNVILDWAKQNYAGQMYLIAHSNGTFVTANLAPDGVKKTVFTGVVNIPAALSIDRLRDRILARGGEFNEKGISIYPRTGGQTQKVGPKWWQEIREFDAIKAINKFAAKTELILFKPVQDEILGNEHFENYRALPVKYVELNGDHSFSKPEDRKILIGRIRNFFKSERHVAICVFYDKDLNIVVQERGEHSKAGEKYGFWGGQIETGETKEETIIRELKEELGYSPKKIEFWGSSSYVIPQGKYKDWKIFTEIFISPITPELLKAKIIEGASLAKFPIDTIIENKNHYFGYQSAQRMRKIKKYLVGLDR